MNRRLAAPLLLVSALALGCGTPTASSPTATDTNSASTSATTGATTTATPADCAKTATKVPGTLTIATDSPAYDPWFSHNDPSNGKGYESAVAYAVAGKLGFDQGRVKWVKERFNNSYAPGQKNFDFDINEVSITAARARVVDFSDGYYTAAQALVMLKGGSTPTTLAQLKGLKLGAQTGTTSLTALRDEVKPSQQPVVFQDSNAPKQALLNHQVQGIVVDLPTAFYITAAEIPQARIVGQFQQQSGTPEQFGMLFQKGSALVPCVNSALAELKSDGTLASIEKQWLSDTVNVPVLK